MDFIQLFITPELFCRWEQLLDELNVVHQMYPYSLSNSGITEDVKCAFLIELAEPLIEIVNKYTNLFVSLTPRDHRPVLKDCLDALITKYGRNILVLNYQIIMSFFISTG